MTGSPEPLGCNSRSDVFMDSEESFLHVADPYRGKLQVFDLDRRDTLQHVQTLDVSGLRQALISNDDSRVYAVTRWSLLVFERDAETGRLTQVPRAGNNAGLLNLGSIAISSDDRYLFAFDDRGRRTNVFQLEDDPSRPQLLGSLPPFWNAPSYVSRVGKPVRVHQRTEGNPGGGRILPEYGLRRTMASGTDELAATDYVAPWQPDRFNNHVPAFGHTQNIGGESRWQARLSEY